jgi:phage gpG-like protein
VKLEVKEKGVTQAKVDLSAMGERSSDIRRLSEQTRSIVRKSNDRRFHNRGDGSWPALNDEYATQKTLDGYDPRPLRRKNMLYRALTSPRAAGQIDQRDKTEFRFGTNLPYARYADHGTQNEPQRKLIELRMDEQKRISDLINRYIAKGQNT